MSQGQRISDKPSNQGIEAQRVRGRRVGGQARRTHVLDDDGVDARLCDASHHFLELLELSVEDQDVERHVAVHTTLMEVLHHLWKLRLGVKVGRTRPAPTMLRHVRTTAHLVPNK
jgi:hypothetical protein